jgi:heterodisulfide reductase subunit A
MYDTTRKVIGSIMIVGGGIAGVQAALDLADTGYFVYLVEESEAIGGVMSALDKTFPTNDCSMCILSPKLVECGRHINIQIFPLTQVLEVEGEAGNFQVKLYQKARYVDVDKCIACGVCAEKCPRKVPDKYNLGLNSRKAAYVKYPQAVPLKYAIDKEHCIYFEKGKCRACEKFCPAGAINFDDRDREFTFDVGSVILSPGLETFDPRSFDTFNYARYPNVLTSMEFERLLSPSGPHQGHVLRPSDGKEPKKIAWIQCVGSRDVHEKARGYCSSVCCTYAIKEAVVAKEHLGEGLDTAIYYIDLRTHGKEFERYYNRAKEQYGVRFIKSKVSSLLPADDSGTLLIRYINDSGLRVEEKYDMVVLSVGLCVSRSTVDLAHRLKIDLDPVGLPITGSFSPVSTSRPGIFVCGTFQGPKDIPHSVMESSAAAAESASLLSGGRGTRISKPREVKEIDVAGENPRIGVFVCHCGINIGSVVDVPAVKEYAEVLPFVVYVEENLFTCSQDTQDKIKKVIAEHNLNRIVVASCSPRTHESLFQQTIREAGLNKYLFELANIRDQNSWVHQKEPEAATEKAKDLVRMAVAKVALQQPLAESRLSITKSGLVIGGGVAGMEAALSLAEQGYPVTILEKKEVLGGHAGELLTTWKGESVSHYLDGLRNRVEAHRNISLRLQAKVKEVKGFVGNFLTTIELNRKEEELPHGVTIIATGGDPYRPTEYGYGKSDRVYLNLELDRVIEERREKVISAQTAVFIQCVGSRDSERPYCSRVCCTHSIKNALSLKRLNPDMHIFILHRDIRTYGQQEDLYRKAREHGVSFIRFTPDRKPLVETNGNKLTVTVFDTAIQKQVSIQADVLALATAIVPHNTEHLARMFKVPRNADGFFLEAHMKLRPVDFATEGVFVAGLAHYPKPMEESIAQAKAAASRASTILARDFILAGGATALINKQTCCGCKTCIDCCPFGAISYVEPEGKCEVNQAMCKGCGTCAAACPSEAVSLLGFSHEQLYRQIDEALSMTSGPRLFAATRPSREVSV